MVWAVRYVAGEISRLLRRWFLTRNVWASKKMEWTSGPVPNPITCQWTSFLRHSVRPARREGKNPGVITVSMSCPHSWCHGLRA